MFDGFGVREHLMINALGHTAGVLVFGDFLYLALWNRPTRRAYTGSLAVFAAFLALTWNLFSLGGIVSGQEGTLAARILAGVAFCALSLLPAVLLNICLLEHFPSVIRAGYALSLAAVVAHAAEVFGAPFTFHRVGLNLVTAGFGLLTLIAVVRLLWSGGANPRGLGSRLFAAMALFLFAMSFAHFSDVDSPRAWATELVFHHAGIPLALVILIQDYRFVFLDAFIRFLANGLLAGIFGVGLVIASAGLSLPVQAVVAALALALFALVRGLFLRFLSTMVFREVELEPAIHNLQDLAGRSSTEADFIASASRGIARQMQTQLLDTSLDPGSVSGRLLLPTLAAELPDAKQLRAQGVEVLVPVPLADGAIHTICLGERDSGRRYLSSDLDALARLAACVAQQAERIREAELRTLLSQAELRALHAQIHPHFLFNALNTLYGIIPRQATAARELLLSLADLLRYALHSERSYIPLAEELRIVRAYLSIEALRLGNRLRSSIDVDDAALQRLIPVLSIEPLVENAVKHGISALPGGGEVRVEVRTEGRGLRIEVRDSGRGFAKSGNDSADHAGVGLSNVSRRLELCYGAASRLEIRSNGDGSSVGFWVPFDSEESAPSEAANGTPAVKDVAR